MSLINQIQPVNHPQGVAISTVSAQSAAFAATTKVVRLCADIGCHVIFGTNPSAGTGSFYLPPNFPQLFSVPPGQGFKVAGKVATGTGNLFVTEGDQI